MPASVSCRCKGVKGLPPALSSASREMKGLYFFKRNLIQTLRARKVIFQFKVGKWHHPPCRIHFLWVAEDAASRLMPTVLADGEGSLTSLTFAHWGTVTLCKGESQHLPPNPYISAKREKEKFGTSAFLSVSIIYSAKVLRRGRIYKGMQKCTSEIFQTPCHLMTFRKFSSYTLVLPPLSLFYGTANNRHGRQKPKEMS